MKVHYSGGLVLRTACGRRVTRVKTTAIPHRVTCISCRISLDKKGIYSLFARMRKRRYNR